MNNRLPIVVSLLVVLSACSCSDSVSTAVPSTPDATITGTDVARDRVDLGQPVADTLASPADTNDTARGLFNEIYDGRQAI